MFPKSLACDHHWDATILPTSRRKQWLGVTSIPGFSYLIEGSQSLPWAETGLVAQNQLSAQTDQLTQHGANSPSAAAGHSQDSSQACSLQVSLRPHPCPCTPRSRSTFLETLLRSSALLLLWWIELEDSSTTVILERPSSPSFIQEKPYLQMSLTGPEDGGSYHCRYWIDQGRSWNRSSSSDTVLIRVKARRHFWVRELAVGGSFFTINGLIFLISHLCMKSKGSKEEHTGVSDPFQSDYYSVPVQLVIRQSGHSATAKANHISSPMSRGNNEYQEEV
ncbi:uncharacterized protein LOC119841668 [Dermochelys coriacea]|uniref:uncharacterized protein LOC119841668 n=1 Tax=Dermochelys coriacea TaxID=27794 RepID=UPI0018E866FC|nr:uncharacterized protein LOC119841668 [Dermochelys coriacea]